MKRLGREKLLTSSLSYLPKYHECASTYTLWAADGEVPQGSTQVYSRLQCSSQTLTAGTAQATGVAPAQNGSWVG